MRDDVRRLFWWSYAVPRVVLVPREAAITAARAVPLLQGYLERPESDDLSELLAEATQRAMAGGFLGRPFP